MLELQIIKYKLYQHIIILVSIFKFVKMSSIFGECFWHRALSKQQQQQKQNIAISVDWSVWHSTVHTAYAHKQTMWWNTALAANYRK